MKAIIAAVLAVALAPGAIGLSVQDDVVAYYVGEDFNGVQFKMEIRESQLDHSTRCTGTAPAMSDCSTGAHSLGWFTSHGIIIPVCGSGSGAPSLPSQVSGPCFVGGVQSVLGNAGAERRFNCEMIQMPGRAGTVVNEIACSGQGTFPTGTATHDCHARAYGTNDNTENGGGVPLAVGTFGCQISHF